MQICFFAQFLDPHTDQAPAFHQGDIISAGSVAAASWLLEPVTLYLGHTEYLSFPLKQVKCLLGSDSEREHHESEAILEGKL